MLVLGDNLEWMKKQPGDSVDLIITSPPYEHARTYEDEGGELKFDLRGDEYVEWCLERFMECLRICRGIVAWVIEGVTEDFRYSITPFKLMVAIEKAGGVPRKPHVYRRDGMPGGSPDYPRNAWEPILVFTKHQGKLPYYDMKACGTLPKYGAGGAMSHRNRDGSRLTDKTRKKLNDLMEKEGISQREAARRLGLKQGHATSSKKHGDTVSLKEYVPPDIAKPKNVIECGAVGGGHLGSNIAHENEAPFPEKVPEFFIRSFCPPGGRVLDPFVGSGTTIAAAIKSGRCWIGIDQRKSQIKLCRRRIKQARIERGFGLI